MCNFRKIGVVCAMQKERDLIAGRFPEEAVRCVLSGIGKVNAAMAAERLISDCDLDCILSVGCAGTFAEEINEGETVIVSRCAYHDVWTGDGCEPGRIPGLPLFFESDKDLLGIAGKALPDAHIGLLCTGDQFYVSAEEDARQKRWFPDAKAIDMEGAAVAQAAHIHKIPFLALKVISDNHVKGCQQERYDNFWASMAAKSFDSVRSLLDNLLTLRRSEDDTVFPDRP